MAQQRPAAFIRQSAAITLHIFRIRILPRFKWATPQLIHCSDTTEITVSEKRTPTFTGSLPPQPQIRGSSLLQPAAAEVRTCPFDPVTLRQITSKKTMT